MYYAKYLWVVFIVWSTVAIADQPNASDAKTISGVVVDSNANAVSQAIVSLWRHSFGEKTAVFAQVESDQNGGFSIPLPASAIRLKESPGRWVVKVLSPQHAIQSQRWSFSDDEQTALKFQLKAASELKVHVLDQQQRPIKGAGLQELTSVSTGTILPQDWKTLGVATPASDADGWLTIPNYDASVAGRFSIEHPKFASTTASFDPTNAETPIVEMDPGQEVRFKVICKSDPKAAAKATISLRISGRNNSSRRTLAVDEHGEVVARLADKRTTIHISHPTLYGLPWYHYRANQHREIEFTLHRSAVVKGRVIDQKTKKGVEGVTVHFVRTRRVIEYGRTDENGDYEVTLPALGFEVSVAESADLRTDGTRHNIYVSAESNEPVPLLTVQQRLPVQGRVVTRDGKIVPNALIVIGFRDAAILADEKGRFEFKPDDGHDKLVQALHPYKPLSEQRPRIRTTRRLKSLLKKRDRWSA